MSMATLSDDSPTRSSREHENDLVRGHLVLVGYAVNDFARRLPRHVCRADLESAGMEGLAQAARSYDPARGVAFDRYAAYRIKGALLDELRRLDWVGRTARSTARNVEQAHDDLTSRLGRTPTPAEVADEAGVDLRVVHKVGTGAHRANMLHGDAIVEAAERADNGLEGRTPEGELLDRERRAYLLDAVAALPERLRRVVVAYFFEERQMKELARELGVSEGRVSRCAPKRSPCCETDSTAISTPTWCPNPERRAATAAPRSAPPSTLPSPRKATTTPVSALARRRRSADSREAPVEPAPRLPCGAVDDTTRLPHWDVSTIFPALSSREFAFAHEGLGASIDRLRALYDEQQVHAGTPHEPSMEEVAALETVLAATNEVLEATRTLSAYLHTFVSTDARNDDAARLRSQLQSRQATLDTLAARLDGWVATLGAEHLVAASSLAADHAYPLQRAEVSATHRLAEGEEDLFAELSVTGGKAWSRLHGEITSRLHATVAFSDGTSARLPITVVRAFATHPDPQRRQAAFEGELAAWEEAAVPLAAALNAIKGEANTINRRRRWADPLAPALFANGVDRPTLEAMQEAARATFPDFRHYLRAKAVVLGHAGGLPWWDLFAPVGEDSQALDWETATGAIGDVFAGYSPALAGLARPGDRRAVGRRRTPRRQGRRRLLRGRARR